MTKERQKKRTCGSVDRRRIDFLPNGYASTPLVFFSSSGSLKKKKKKILVKRRRRSPERSCDTEIVPWDLSISNASQKCAWHVNQVLSPFETNLEHIKPYELLMLDFFLTVFQEHTSLKAARTPFVVFSTFSSFISHSGNLLFHLA